MTELKIHIYDAGIGPQYEFIGDHYFLSNYASRGRKAYWFVGALRAISKEYWKVTYMELWVRETD